MTKRELHAERVTNAGDELPNANALGCLLASLAGLAVSLVMGAQGPWAWLKAFCEAAAIGGLADWFAVVALFRHPLGLPIPHTALIPQGNKRLARRPVQAGENVVPLARGVHLPIVDE